MYVEILFTKSEKLGSKLIRKITKEDVSHCAIKVGLFVVHSSFTGVQSTTHSEFLNSHEVVHSVAKEVTLGQVKTVLLHVYGKPYDYVGFLRLGLRALLPKSMTSKIPLEGVSGTFLCTEFVSDVLLNQELLITPYQLYLKLKS